MNMFRAFQQLRSSDVFKERNRLLSKLQGRSAFTEEDINEVFAYRKLGYHSNSEAVKVTEKAFDAQELGDKLRLLKRLNGVGMMVASSILMFQSPYRYAEINHKTWNYLRRNHGLAGSDKDHKSDFAVGEYQSYLEALSLLAGEFGMNVSEVEFVINSTG